MRKRLSRLFGSLFRFFRDNNLSNVRQPLVGESGETAPVDSGQKIISTATCMAEKVAEI